MLRLGRKPVQMLNRKISARIPHPSVLMQKASPGGEAVT